MRPAFIPAAVLENRIKKKQGMDVEDEQGNILCKSPEDKWLIISKDDIRHFCDGVPDCKSGSDELCPYVTINVERNIVNITREQWKAGGAIMENYFFCALRGYWKNFSTLCCC